MKRHYHLYEKICSFENLLLAARRAQRGKKLKSSVSEFNLDFEKEIFALQAELQSQTYRVGRYKQFHIYDPKKRLISALPYKERVVQHALCNVIEPIFDQALIFDSYACRKGRGSHKAVERFTEFSRKNCYVLKCDVKSYFASIDHETLYGMIKKKIKDLKTLWLIKQLIDSTVSPGIPIGNLSSQIFANLYLNELDHYLKETVKCKYYIRYMDDLIFFSNDKCKLRGIKETIKNRLKELMLELHANKCQIYQSCRGVSFLGYKIYPSHRLVIKQNVKRLRHRMKKYFKLLSRKLITRQKIASSIQSWLGYAIHADSFHLKRRILSEYNLGGISP